MALDFDSLAKPLPAVRLSQPSAPTEQAGELLSASTRALLCSHRNQAKAAEHREGREEDARALAGPRIEAESPSMRSKQQPLHMHLQLAIVRRRNQNALAHAAATWLRDCAKCARHADTMGQIYYSK
jgi:hypothetical protein